MLLNPADIVVIDATAPEEAIAEIRQPRASISAGDGWCRSTRPNSFDHDERGSGNLMIKQS